MKQILLSLLLLCSMGVSAQDVVVTRQKKQQTTTTKPNSSKPTSAKKTNTTASKPKTQSKPTSGYVNGHEWIDLGLSVKWASCNVGASSPSDYGGYYAWGETQPKTEYNKNNYKLSKGTYTSYTKYCSSSSYGNNGFVDRKSLLDPVDDAARVNWGNYWRMPTYSEWSELSNLCSWTWTLLNGVRGFKVVGPNGNSIFLPVAGHRWNTNTLGAGEKGKYWSSNLGQNTAIYAYFIDFWYAEKIKTCIKNITYTDGSRDYGRSIRPILD